jgi:hypothetical protein
VSKFQNEVSNHEESRTALFARGLKDERLRPLKKTKIVLWRSSMLKSFRVIDGVDASAKGSVDIRARRSRGLRRRNPGKVGAVH